MDRIQVVRDLAQGIIDKYEIQKDGIRHYSGCWKVHMYCFASTIMNVTEGDQPS